jgi:hypothetical protein
MEQPFPSTVGSLIPENLPPDFARRLAQKIVFTVERERDQDEALEKVAGMLVRNLSKPGRARQFIDVIEALLENEETARYAGLAWVSIVLHREEDARYDGLVSAILDAMIQDHQQIAKPNVQLEYRRKSFSFYAKNLGDAFIAMVEIKAELYEVVSSVYSNLIRKEVALENAEKERRSSSSRRISLTERDEEKPKTGKKLFDDAVDYVHSRGELRSDTLSQQNPNEFIAILADRMRGTRRYVIQDIMSKQALEKRKEVEKELSERLASAEEIIQARESFRRAMDLFWTEKRYNIKYMSIEKVRITLQIICVVSGILWFLAGYLGLGGFQWYEGLGVAVGMYLFARFSASRKAFRSFFPNDVSKELEVMLGTSTPTLRKMSKEQMDAFMIRQIKDPSNLSLLPILPEFFKYVFAVMPDRKEAILTPEELAELLENIETDISRVIRTSTHRMGL